MAFTYGFMPADLRLPAIKVYLIAWHCDSICSPRYAMLCYAYGVSSHRRGSWYALNAATAWQELAVLRSGRCEQVSESIRSGVLMSLCSH